MSNVFDVRQLDLSSMVGHEIKLFSEQFAGKELCIEVLSVSDGQILGGTGTGFEAINNLVNNQSVVLQFIYRGEGISIKARFKRIAGGRCYLQLEDEVTPLTRRKFRRITLNSEIRLATFATSGLTIKELDKLRWMQTNMIDFSSGGALVEIPSRLSIDVHLLMNIEFELAVFPKLILARVCHIHQTENRQFHAGVEFVVRERASKLFTPASFKELQSVLSYRSADRERFNKELIYWQSTKTESLR